MQLTRIDAVIVKLIRNQSASHDMKALGFRSHSIGFIPRGASVYLNSLALYSNGDLVMHQIYRWNRSVNL